MVKCRRISDNSAESILGIVTTKIVPIAIPPLIIIKNNISISISSTFIGSHRLSANLVEKKMEIF